MKNVLKTGLLLGVLSVLLIFIGQMLGGQQGILIAFAFALVMNVGTYWFSDKIVLAMYRAQPLSREDDPRFYRMVERLCERANLPLPRLYVIPDPTPNAFATGRDPKHAAVAVNEGLLRMLNEDEIEGVVAHELAHVKNRDTLVSTVAATITAAITMLARMAQWSMIFAGGHNDRDRESTGQLIGTLVLVIVAPIAALILQLWISRTREYMADRTGSEICGRPLALASALRKLEMASQARPMAHAEPATASLFIVNPLKGQAMMALFSTHPPMADRIAKLESLAAEMKPGPAYNWR